MLTILQVCIFYAWANNMGRAEAVSELEHTGETSYVGNLCLTQPLAHALISFS